MLIEQISEFKSKVPGSLVAYIFLKLIILKTKQNSKANLAANYLMVKTLQKAI